MIGVLARTDQRATVAELFELFKTPWEFWRPNRSYEAVIVTAEDDHDIRSRLVLVYGSSVRHDDVQRGLRVRSRQSGGRVEYRGTSIPIHRDLLVFSASSGQSAEFLVDGQPAGLRAIVNQQTVIRIGYDLFDEVQFLLSNGQPVSTAHVPALDLHIAVLREVMRDAGISFVEVAPTPAGSPFTVCLTHDIDFVGIRRHGLDHTLLGFLYRSTVGALQNYWRRKLSLRKLVAGWRAVATLPFVYLGWARDFWSPFEWYLDLEASFGATYFLIPFKGRSGEHVDDRVGTRRAAPYDVHDIAEWTSRLQAEGCEVGVHGIDGWHSAAKGRDELARVQGLVPSASGVRTHWLLKNAESTRLLDEAGYDYDSTEGYNETIGYRNGTTQIFRPLNARTLLELPLHVQDGALFYAQRLNLSEEEAWNRCRGMIEHASRSGGVLTVLWHDRSHAPERFWGEFYTRLVGDLKSRGAWFTTAARAVKWFQARRAIQFTIDRGADGFAAVRLSCEASPINPPVTVRAHHKSKTVDTVWNGETPMVINFGLSGTRQLALA